MCCLTCTVASKLDESCCVPFFIQGGTIAMRTKLRTQYGIRVGPLHTYLINQSFNFMSFYSLKSVSCISGLHLQGLLCTDLLRRSRHVPDAQRAEEPWPVIKQLHLSSFPSLQILELVSKALKVFSEICLTQFKHLYTMLNCQLTTIVTIV